ncbi:MAG: hypothetical protein KBF93_26040 [Leptospiraceae bacterium]|nr:hypothetical protein [Leptospiraceae bacterium]
MAKKDPNKQIYYNSNLNKSRIAVRLIVSASGDKLSIQFIPKSLELNNSSLSLKSSQA